MIQLKELKTNDIVYFFCVDDLLSMQHIYKSDISEENNIITIKNKDDSLILCFDVADIERTGDVLYDQETTSKFYISSSEEETIKKYRELLPLYIGDLNEAIEKMNNLNLNFI